MNSTEQWLRATKSMLTPKEPAHRRSPVMALAPTESLMTENFQLVKTKTSDTKRGIIIKLVILNSTIKEGKLRRGVGALRLLLKTCTKSTQIPRTWVTTQIDPPTYSLPPSLLSFLIQLAGHHCYSFYFLLHSFHLFPSAIPLFNCNSKQWHITSSIHGVIELQNQAAL
jgi:hypothetical protein